VAAELSREAIDLLLQILEGHEPVLAGAAAALRPEAAAPLIEGGLLKADGYDDVAVLPHAEDDTPVPLFAWSAPGHLAGFDPSSGPVTVPSAHLIRWVVDVPLLLTAVAASLDLPARWRPSEYAAGLIWELGDVRIGQRNFRQPLWFARRLWDPRLQKQLGELVTARPHPRQRVLLTSSPRPRLEGLAIAGTTIISVPDVLACPDKLTVSAEIIEARLSGVAQAVQAEPIALSEDGTTLLINGTETIFKAQRHIDAIRKLVAAYHAGQRLRATDLTPHGGLEKLFGKKRWQEISVYIKSRSGRWGFEP
jgi:hypothetical protein